MRATGADHAREARRQKGRILATVLADMDGLHDPAALIDETPLFWETITALAKERLGLTRLTPPAGTDGVQCVIDSVRAIRGDRERVGDSELFDSFKPRVVQP